MRDRFIRLPGRVFNRLSKLKGPNQTWGQFMEPLIPGIKKLVEAEKSREKEPNPRNGIETGF